MGAQIKVVTEFTAKDNFSSTVKKMIKNMKSFSVKGVAYMNKVERRVTSLYKKMGALQRLGLGLGAAFVIREGIDGILDFEEGLVMVKKTTGLADKEIRLLGLGVLDLDKKMRGVGTKKLLSLSGIAGQMGIGDRESILKFSESMAMLEKATDIEGEEGALFISRMLKVTKTGVKDVDKFNSSLVALGNNIEAFESEILVVGSEVARSVAAYDIGAANILGLSAALKALNVNPEAAGTAIGITFKQIEQAVLRGGKKLKAASQVTGMSPLDIKAGFKDDPQKIFMSFLKGLNRIKKEGGSVQDTLIKMGLSSRIVSKGIVPLADDYDNVVKTLKLAHKEYKSGTALQIEYKEAIETVRTGLNEVGNAWKRAMIKLGGSKDSLVSMRKLLFWIADNMENLIKATATILTLWVAAKTILIAYNSVMFAKNVLLGTSVALTGANSVALIGNTTATIAATTANSFLSTGMSVLIGLQSALNFVMAMNPIGLVVIAVVALVGIIATAIKYYDEWGATLLMFLGPLGAIVNMIMGFVKYWDLIKKSFSDGGIVEGIKTIGKVILDSLLYPMEQFFGLISKIPGLGSVGLGGEKWIKGVRDSLNLEGGQKEQTKTYGSPEAISYSSMQEKLFENSLNINIKKEKGFDIDAELNGPSDVPISLTNTY